MRALVFAGFALLAGCVPLLTGPVAIPKVEVKRLVDTPLPVTTAPEAIRVLDGKDALPRGFFYYTDARGGSRPPELHRLRADLITARRGARNQSSPLRLDLIYYFSESSFLAQILQGGSCPLGCGRSPRCERERESPIAQVSTHRIQSLRRFPSGMLLTR